jgi:hypothetical protein
VTALFFCFESIFFLLFFRKKEAMLRPAVRHLSFSFFPEKRNKNLVVKKTRSVIGSIVWH